ncbi:MAG: leucine-rich repeat protein [Oscillospiraceae bacterium]|nr:leucine-rich repeat protein [Oscillospiraceae bacterium]
MKKSTLSRILSILLVMSMMVAWLPGMGIYAAEADMNTASGNDGSEGIYDVPLSSGDEIDDDLNDETLDISYDSPLEEIDVDENDDPDSDFNLPDFVFGGNNGFGTNEIDISPIQGFVPIIPLSSIIDGGELGDELLWTLDDMGNLRFTGTGEIPQSAFAGDLRIRDVLISDGIIGIGASAFAGCINLLFLEFEQGLTSIGTQAFDGCNKIIGTLVIPDTVTSIGEYAFRNCTSLTGNLDIPGSVATIGQSAFRSCTGLNGTLTLGYGVVTIGADAFRDCANLVGDLIIPDSVTYIGNTAFYNCSGFNGTLRLSENLTAINNEAFRLCTGIVGEITIPDKVTTVGSGAFLSMTSVTSVVLGTGVTAFAYFAGPFNGCTGITELTFTGLTVPSLYDGGTFTNIANLKTVYVPAERYDAYAAAYASLLPSGASIRIVGGEDDFFIEDGVLKAYLGNGGEVVIPDGVAEIGTGAFQNNKEITKVTLNVGLTKIGNFAFQGCTELTEIVFNYELETIGSYAFQGCTKLTTLNLKDDYPEAEGAYVLETIGSYAFQGCIGIAELKTCSSLKTIGNFAFTGCISLESLELNQGLLTIGDQAFDGCNKIMGTLVIPDTVTYIGEYAFRNCTSLTGNLDIPGSVATIGQSAFRSCTGLNGTLTLGYGVVTIGADAFRDCANLVGDLIIPDSVTYIGNTAFYNCSGFNGTLRLSENLTAINNEAFRLCTGIVGEITIPDKVTTVGSGAFLSMTSVTSVVLGTGVTAFAYFAGPFNGCTGITELTFTGLTVPSLYDGGTFTNIANLKTVYVPALVYTSYVNAYQALVGPNVEFSSNTLPMSVPNLQAERVYSKTIQLSWSKHVNPAVTRYIVRRDGVIISETIQTSFIDRNLTTDQTYTYEVYGLTADNAETGRSNIQATPRLPVINEIRTDNELNKIGGNQNNIYIDTVNSKNYQSLGSESVTGLLYYMENNSEILIGQASIYTVTTSTVTYSIKWDVAYIDNGAYTLLFRLTDVDGQSTEFTEAVTVDHTGPERIANLVALGDIAGIRLSWSIASEIDTTRYRIYRRSEIDSNFYIHRTIDGRNIVSYLDETVVEDRLYSYYVVGVNSLGQEGLPSEIATAIKGVDEEPPQVTRMLPASGSFINALTTITVTAQDNVSVTKVELYTSIDDGETWDIYSTKIGAPYTFQFNTTAFADGAIRIRAIAYDARDNESIPLAYIYSIDNTGPEKVEGLAFSSTSVTITLSWDDVADNDISFFRVERKNADNSYTTLMDVSKTLGANILNLLPNTQYTFRVVGYDHLSNRGTPSDDIVATTQTDTTDPVISSIMPRPGYFANELTVSITGDDDYAIASIAVQVSINGTAWQTVHTETFPQLQKTRTVTYTIDLTGYNEGPIYVRGIATDEYGNKSDSSDTAPFVQHIINRTPPMAPTGVQAVDRNGIVEVIWQESMETDIASFGVYRSTQADSGYEKLAGNLATLNYFDRSGDGGTVYYYKVSAIDLAGNESELSEAAMVEISQDSEKPIIVSVYPMNGSSIGLGWRTVSAYITDNRMLDEIKVEYKNKDVSAYIQLAVFSSVNNHERTVSVSVPMDGFDHDDIVDLRITAVDKAGNISDSYNLEYTIDKEAPSVISPLANYDNESVILTWQSDMADDLLGYKIYRATNNGSYSLIAQQPAISGKLDYAFADYSIAKTSQQYSYRIDALDNVGNVGSFYTNSVIVPNRTMPVAVINCDTVMEIGVDYEIDALQSTADAGIASYTFDMGDGTVYSDRRVVHRYTQLGEHTITLTITDTQGNQSMTTKQITVRERALLGIAEIRVVDEEGRAVSGASVYFDLGEPHMVVKQTNVSGYATFTAEVGVHAVGCIIPNNEWLPSKRDVLVTAGETAQMTMTMIHQPMIEGEFEIHRMTFEEIIAAGIDISKPENQYIVNIVVTLTYVKLDFYYNPPTGNIVGGNPTMVYQGISYTAIPISGSGGYNQGDPNSTPSPNDISVIVVEIPVQASTLKEFFNVKLHIINNAAAEFSMLDNLVTLNVPEGLTIIDTVVSESERAVYIADIPGQTRSTINWILRGDMVGEYWLTADYVGTLALFQETIATQFIAKDPVEVLGLQGLKLQIDVADEIYQGDVYYNVSLFNESDREVYVPNVFGEDVLRRTVFIHTNGTKELVTELPFVLYPGEGISRHYFVHVLTDYTNARWVLMSYFYTVGETYGLAIDLIPRPVPFFFEDIGTPDTNKEALKAAIDATTELDEEEYIIESWEDLQLALDNAVDCYENPLASRVEIDEATTALLDAITALEKKPPQPDVDYSVFLESSSTNANKGDIIYIDVIVSSESESGFNTMQSSVLFDNDLLSYNPNESIFGDYMYTNVVGSAFIFGGFEINAVFDEDGRYKIATIAFDVIAGANESVKFIINPDLETYVSIETGVEGVLYVDMNPISVMLRFITVSFKADTGTNFEGTPVTAYARYGETGLFESDTYLEAFIIPTVVAQTGYALEIPVWSDGTSSYSAGEIAAMSFTQSAVFTAKAYGLNAVRFIDFDGIQIGETQYIDNGEFASAPVAEPIEHMTFKGWYIVTNEDQIFDDDVLITKSLIDETIVTGDVMYKAHYTWNSFTITGDIDKINFISGVDNIGSPYMVTYGIDVVFDVESAPIAYRYDVFYSVGDGERTKLEPEDNGEYTIAGEEITGNIVLQLVSVVDAKIRFIDFEIYRGAPASFKVALVSPSFALDTAWTIAYENENATVEFMYWSDNYEAYVWFVDSILSENDVLNQLRYVSGISVTIAYDGDVNRNGRINVQDAQIVHDLSNNRLLDGFTSIGMLERLEADVNGDGVVDSMDSQAIMYIILNP